jgi:hypothetical protein
MDVETKILENGDLELKMKYDNEDDKLNLEADFHTPENYQDAKSEIMEAIHDGYRIMSDEEKMLIGDLTDAEILTDITDTFDPQVENRVFMDAIDGTIKMPKILKQNIDKCLKEDWNERSWVDMNNTVHDWVEKLVKFGETTLTLRKNA